MKYLLIIFLCLFPLNFVFSDDPSTPLNGNLYSSQNSPFIPSESIIYSDTSILEMHGLITGNGRIYSTLHEPTEGIYNILDRNVGSDISTSEEGFSIVLTGNSERYRHGILGDKNEATGFSVVKNNELIGQYELGGNQVFETLRALIADIIPENDGDEILLTVSDSTLGSRIEVFSLQGEFFNSMYGMA